MFDVCKIKILNRIAYQVDSVSTIARLATLFVVILAGHIVSGPLSQEKNNLRTRSNYSQSFKPCV